MQHRVGLGVAAEIGVQILAAAVVDVAGIDVGAEQIDVEAAGRGTRRCRAESLQVPRAACAKVAKSSPTAMVRRRRIVGEPDFAQHAGVDARVPHPARHQRIVLGRGEMQHFGGEIARPSGARGRPETLPTNAPSRGISRGRVGSSRPAARQGGRCMCGKAVAAEPGADPPAHRRDEGGEIAELGLASARCTLPLPSTSSNSEALSASAPT